MKQRILTYSVFLLLLGAFFSIELFAHPGFARKYRMSCTTCHNPAPRLKPYGEDFAGNGFVLEGEEPERYHPDTGDDLLLLQAIPPIGFRLDAYAVFKPGAESPRISNDLQTPYMVKFITGGRLSEWVSYYFYMYYDERGEVAGVEDAYLYFRQFLGSPVGVAIGQFQVSDPLFKRELRLTFEDYIIYTTQVGRIPLDLGYDRGIMAGYTAPFGSDFTLEIVNGNGLSDAVNRQFDDDNYKNVGLRWSHGFGPVRLGAFGYYGKYSRDEDNTTNVIGPDATLELGKLQLNAQYLLRTDTNPMLRPVSPDDNISTSGGLVEAIYEPDQDRSRWYLIGLYNWRNSDITDIYPTANPLEYQSASIAWTYLMARNLRLLTEFTYDIENENNRLVVGFFSAF